MTTQIARHWRLNAQRYRLIGNVCPACNRKIFPPRDVCPHCAEKAPLPFQFNHWTLDPRLVLKFNEDQMTPASTPGEFRVHSEIDQIKV
jgi:hypothetical protein